MICRRSTPLFALPEDEEKAIEMAAFLLAQGADPGIKGGNGLTAEEALRRHGRDEVADFLPDERTKHARGQTEHRDRRS